MESRGRWEALESVLRDGAARAWGAASRLARPVLLAGLSAALAGAACSSATVAPSDAAQIGAAGTAQAPNASAPAPDGAAEAAPIDSGAGAPAIALRPARAPHPYSYLWQAAIAGGDPAARRVTTAATTGTSAPTQDAPSATLAPRGDADPPPGAPGAAQAGTESAASNGPESAGAPATIEAPPAADAQNGRTWSEQDLADLAPYLQGIASWYGPNFHGKLTANGETYNQYGLTAAHPVLPIGTRILVENLDNGRRVWLRINDRGPYAKGRILDLSRIAAERLGMIEQGTAPVRITVLKWPDTVQASFGLKPFQQFTVQSAAYPELDRAEALRERLQARFPELPFFVEPASSGFFAVAAGPFDDESEAKQVSRKIHRSGLNPIVRRYRN